MENFCQLGFSQNYQLSERGTIKYHAWYVKYTPDTEMMPGCLPLVLWKGYFGIDYLRFFFKVNA